MREGKITPNGMVLETHEYATLIILTNNGMNVELMRPSRAKGVKTGDFMMMGMVWEMKSPIGNARSTIEHNFQKAAKQAKNIVIDLRRTKIADEQAIRKLEKDFWISRSVRNLWIVTKKDEIVKMRKKRG